MRDLFGHPPLDPGIEPLIPTWEQRGPSIADDTEIAAGMGFASENNWTLHLNKLRLCFESTLALWSPGEDLSHAAWRAVQRHVNETVDRMQNGLRGKKYRPNYAELQRKYHDTVMWMFRQRRGTVAEKTAKTQLPLAAE